MDITDIIKITSSENFQIIRTDIKKVKKYILNNDINEYLKLNILYSICIFINNLYLLYYISNYISKDNSDFITQIRNIYLFFFIICSLRSSYLYILYNISKIDKDLSNNLYKNTIIKFNI